MHKKCSRFLGELSSGNIAKQTRSLLKFTGIIRFIQRLHYIKRLRKPMVFVWAKNIPQGCQSSEGYHVIYNLSLSESKMDQTGDRRFNTLLLGYRFNIFSFTYFHSQDAWISAWPPQKDNAALN